MILKFAAAGTVLLGLTAPLVAAPDDDATIEAASSRYDSPEVIEKIGSASLSRGDTSSRRRSTEAQYVNRSRNDDCPDCRPRRRYDDREVIKKIHNIDRSRVINTVSVMPAGRRTREYNRLVIRKNEIRNVGVVQHNHLIVEKEVRYV